MLSGWIGRDDGFAAARGEPVAQLSGIVGPVGEQLGGCRDALQHGSGADQVVDISRRQGEGDRAAMLVGQGVNLSRPSAARSADGVPEAPPFAPAAERCALTWVESTAAAPITPLEPVRA